MTQSQETAVVQHPVSDGHGGTAASTVSITVVPANHAPVTNAGPGQTVECQGGPTSVALDGRASSDVDGDPLTYAWSEGSTVLGTGATLPVSLGLGVHTITLTVTDPSLASAQSTVTIRVVDTKAPTLTLLGANPLQIDCHSVFSDPGVTASDDCVSVLTSAIQVSGTVNPNAPGTYTLAYQVTDPAGNTATVTRTVNVIASTSSLSGISPSSAKAGTPELELTVNGSCFVDGSLVLWNGASRATTFVSDTQLTVAIGAENLTSADTLALVPITVVNPGGGVSNPEAFTIIASTVGSVESAIVSAGEPVTVSLPPTSESSGGVAATLEHNGERSAAVTVAVYNADPTPVGASFQAAGQFLDVKVSGATVSDSLMASFYYPVGADSANLELKFYNQATGVWETVTPVVNNPLEHSFEVVFNASSHPAITELGGTFFAAAIPDRIPPTIVCPNMTVPCSVDHLVPVIYPTPTTLLDNVDQPSQITLSYSIPSGSGFKAGTTTVTCTATDRSGNPASTTFTVTREALGFSGCLSPLGGADATGGSFAKPLRTFKAGSTVPVKFTAFCAGAPILTGVHRIQVVKYSDTTTSDPPTDATPQSSASSGNQFVLTDGEWHFNLDTKATGMSPGIWLLTATLSDASQHSVWIQLK